VSGQTITTAQELQPALRSMLAHEGPYLLHVQVEQEDNVFPMVPAGCACDEIILEKPGS